MNSEENLLNIKKIKNNLLVVIEQMKLVQSILEESITIDGEVFKKNEICIINDKLVNQLNSLDKKIIYKIENM